MLLLINSCNKRGNFFTSNMSFRMSSDDTVTRVSGEGPGPSPGGIAGHTKKKISRSYQSFHKILRIQQKKKQQQKHRISLESFRESKHAMLVLALQNLARVVSLSSLNKLHFRYFNSSSWVELRLTRMFSMIPSNSR